MHEIKATPKIAINDANLFIDLHEIQLLDSFFSLPLEFHTTNLILNELEDNQRTDLDLFVKTNRLIVRELKLEEIENFAKSTVSSKKLSYPDISIYYYAQELKECMILTGDNKLRKEAEKQGFEVHGILWVLDMFHFNKLIESDLLIEKLKDLMKVNMWLPMGECERLVDRLKISTYEG